MLKQLIRRGAEAFERALAPKPPPDSTAPLFDPRLEEAQHEAQLLREGQRAAQTMSAVLREDRDTWKRKAGEYHALIEGILGERDTWKKMWFDDSSGHQQAQALLEEMIVAGRRAYMRCLKELNAYRVEKGLPALDWNLNPEAPPVGTAAQTAARIERDRAAAPTDIDGIAERDRIAAGSPALSAEGAAPK